MTPAEIWILIGLFGVTIPLVALARRADIPYPVVLVLGGLILGFVPGLPSVQLDPNLVLLAFLPPLLYWEAVTAPTDVMRANAGQIWTLAIGLVVVTTVTVALVAHASIANLAWPMAFVLGAIVAPTDELAASPVLERLKMPRHLIAIVEGESLLNDASALILYAAALGVALGGAFSWSSSLVQFGLASVGGIVLGLLTGRLAVEGWRRIDDTQLQGVISFALPYLTYLTALRLNLSGVLAVVFAGTYVNRFTPQVITPASRLQAVGYWETLVFLVNSILFLLVGLQLHSVVASVAIEYPLQTIVWYALLVNLTVIATRFAYILLLELVPVLGRAAEHQEIDWSHAIIEAWSGLRGAVSLAAALAIPVTMTSGAPLAHRHLVIFLAFSVILVTLVGGGLTLPLVVKRLGGEGDTREQDEDRRRGVAAMHQAALAAIERLEGAGRISGEHAQALRRYYKRGARGQYSAEARAEFDAEREVIEAERDALTELRERREIDNTTLRRLQRILDLAEERLPPAR